MSVFAVSDLGLRRRKRVGWERHTLIGDRRSNGESSHGKESGDDGEPHFE